MIANNINYLLYFVANESNSNDIQVLCNVCNSDDYKNDYCKEPLR